MNLSESAFVRESNVADFGVRYFTPAEEIPLAGMAPQSQFLTITGYNRWHYAHSSNCTLGLK